MKSLDKHPHTSPHPSAKKATKKLLPAFAYLTVLLFVGVGAHYDNKIITSYWRRDSPTIKLDFSFFHRGPFDSSVIQYKRNADEPVGGPRKSKEDEQIEGSPMIKLKITNTRTSLLDTLQVIEVTCDASMHY